MQSLWKKMVLSVGMAATLTGCHPDVAKFVIDETLAAVAHVAVESAIVAAVTSGSRHYAYEHRPVGHDTDCGHDYVIYDEREVYFVEGRWEYYDDTYGGWYYFVDGAPWQ